MAETGAARSVRERLFAAVEATSGDDDDLAGTVLVGFMMIAEWRAGDGQQWLSKVTGDHSGSLPVWRQRGYASEVIHGMWGDQPGEDVDR